MLRLFVFDRFGLFSRRFGNLFSRCLGCFGFWCGWDIGDGDMIDAFVEWNEDNSADARGGKAQKWEYDGSAAFEGGVVQAVPTVADGEYWLSGWLKYETGNGGDPIEPDVAVKIGYDPTGQTSNGNAGTIVWSNDQITTRYLPSHMWHDFGLSVEATGSQTSIWFALDQPTSGTTGKSLKSLTLEFVKQAERIPLVKGTYLGFQYRISKFPPELEDTRVIELRRVLIHPEMTLPDGSTTTGSDYTVSRKIKLGQVNSYDAYGFHEDYLQSN